MDGFLGRDIELAWGGNSPGDVILGIREKGIELNGEAVDVTSDENNGWRTLLSQAGQNEVNISISGVTKDNRLKVDFMTVGPDGKHTRRRQPAIITYPDNSILSGNFQLVSYSETGTYNDATTFEAEIQSSGVVTFVAGS